MNTFAADCLKGKTTNIVKKAAAGDDVIVNIFCFWPILLLIPDCDDGDDNDYDDDVDYVA